MKDNNISKRHHYIPQFILKKFLNDNNLSSQKEFMIQ